ncbi:hypothetical protein CEXT_694651 [Caerostris extrusa]|uniref:Uncharacterized protein n=1 Tax=Caerostris extrusa TaxID=172846 RepID=A0AAV4QJP0_CAEEX|nr:hypothetical protein CEXT_694651 [Caerostris extrusa]
MIDLNIKNESSQVRENHYKSEGKECSSFEPTEKRKSESSQSDATSGKGVLAQYVTIPLWCTLSTGGPLSGHSHTHCRHGQLGTIEERGLTFLRDCTNGYIVQPETRCGTVWSLN